MNVLFGAVTAFVVMFLACLFFPDAFNSIVDEIQSWVNNAANDARN